MVTECNVNVVLTAGRGTHARDEVHRPCRGQIGAWLKRRAVICTTRAPHKPRSHARLHWQTRGSLLAGWMAYHGGWKQLAYYISFTSDQRKEVSHDGRRNAEVGCYFGARWWCREHGKFGKAYIAAAEVRRNDDDVALPDISTLR